MVTPITYKKTRLDILLIIATVIKMQINERPHFSAFLHVMYALFSEIEQDNLSWAGPVWYCK